MATAGEGSGAPGENPRLERMRAALDKFLELIDHKANAKHFAQALPRLDAAESEKLRVQFVRDLKAAIKDDLETLIAKHDLTTRLSQLHTLAREADTRQERAHLPESAAWKDVWRPDLDITTAVRARVDAEQGDRVPEMEKELEELLATNQETRGRIEALEQQTQASQDEMQSALALVDELLASVSQSKEDETALRRTLDTLLAELGPE